MRRLCGSWVFTMALLTTSSTAHADRVAVVPATGSADEAGRNALEVELVQGLTSLGHTVVPDAETKKALAAIADGTADTAEELQTVASTVGADWVVAPTVDPALVTQRVELSAYLASAGRVESVAREVDKARSQEQVREMLAVLLRPEGIGIGALPWEGRPTSPPPPPAPAPRATRPVPEQPPGPSVPPGLVRMRYALDERDVWPPYAAGKPVLVGVLTGFSVAATRAEGATGTSAAFVGALRGGYAIGESGLEVLGVLGGNLAGPRALWIEAGGRWMLTPLGGTRGATGLPLHVGPMIALGAFFLLPGPDVVRNGIVYEDDGSSHFTLRASLDVSYGLSDALRLEAEVGDLRWVPGGGGGALVLVGATVGASMRF